MPDIIITPSTGKLEFVNNSAQNIRKHVFSMDDDGLSLDAPLAATSIKAPLNIINVNVDNSNTNYPFVLASGSAVTGIKTLMMDGAGGTYNPFTNIATIDISGNSATTTLASNSSQLNGQSDSYYTNITARLGYTPVNKAGDTVSGNLTVNGNFTVNGSVTAFSASNIYLSSSVITVEDNILTLNAFSPYLRYAGIEMYDSGSGTLSQLLWDGDGDYFFLTGSSVNGKIITGPDGQTNLTANFVPKATAGYKLGNSLIYDNGTNVAIGTTSPAQKLDVIGNIRCVPVSSAWAEGLSFSMPDTSSWGGLRWRRERANADGNHYIGYVGTDTTDDLVFGSNNAGTQIDNNIRITKAGLVGIGTSSPVAKLHVVGVISGSSFSGAGTGLTGTAASLTAGTATIANGVATGAVKSGGLEENSVITSKIADGNVTNVKLASSSVTIGSSAVSLGSTLTTIAGLTSVTSTTFVGALTGTATTASYANALNPANTYTVTGITGALTGTSSWATNATNALQLGGTAAASYVTLTGTQTLTGKTITGTFTGNLTGTASWASNAVTANALSSMNISQFTNNSLYQYHRGDITSLSSSATNVVQPLGTFDGSNITNAPTSGWYNYLSSTHGSYLTSLIANLHRTADWYVGYKEGPGGTPTNPTWYKLLHSGNYTDYTVTKTGTGASGNWTITSSWATNAVTSLVCTGNAATATTASYANALNAANNYTVAGLTGNLTGTSSWASNAVTSLACTGNAGTVTNGVYTTGNQSIAGTKTFTGVTSFSNTSDYQIVLDGSGGTWAGINWSDVNGVDYMWFNGQNKTFAIGGGGSNVSGKKLHVAGGVTIGVDYHATVVPSNGLSIQGGVQIGNYSTYVINALGASGTQSRTFEIARLGIDYNDWNNIGTFEVELHESYYSQGLKKVYNIWYGYNSNSGSRLVELRGTGDNNFQCRIGSQVQISGDSYYLPVYVDVRYYSYVDVVIKTNRTITTNTNPSIGYTYINIAPTPTNISDFTAGSDLEISTLGSAKLGGNTILTTATTSATGLSIGGTAATASYANALNAANSYTVTGITGNLTGTSSWASNAVTALNVGNGTITIAAGTGVGVGPSNTFTTNQSGATTVTITNNGVTAITTNTGLSTNASATGAVTITNTGVTSITTNTGLSTNVSATGAVTITNSSPNATHTGDVTGATALTIANDAVTTVKILNANVTNAKLANSSVTIGSTAVSLGGTVTTFAGLASVTSTAFVGALTGNVTGNVTGTAGSETFATVTGRGASTTTQISVGTTAGGSMYTGIKSGAGYSDAVSGATFKSITDHPTGGSYAFAAYFNGAPGTGTNSFFVAADGTGYFKGSVGIGTSNATAKLESYYSSNAITFNYLATNLNNNSPIPVYGFDVTNGVGETRSIKAGIGYERHLTNGRGTLHFYNDSTNDTQSLSGNRGLAGDIKMSIDNDGNVGIGSVTPSYKLHVMGNGYFSSTLQVNSNITLSGGGDVIINDSDGTGAFNSFMDSGIGYIRIDDGGSANGKLNINSGLVYIQGAGNNVGIGTTVPGQKLDVEGRIRTRGATGTGGFEIGAATTGTAKWRIEWDSASDSLDFNWVG